MTTDFDCIIKCSLSAELVVLNLIGTEVADDSQELTDLDGKIMVHSIFPFPLCNSFLHIKYGELIMSCVDVRFPLSILGPQSDFFLSHLITFSPPRSETTCCPFINLPFNQPFSIGP